MANFEKFTRGDYGLFAHCERKKDENGQYITFGNQRIDPTRTHLNYNMCPDGGEQRERLEARLSDPNVKCMNRADVVVYGSWCITLPTHVPMEDENGNIIYEEREVHHRDGTVTTETTPKLKEISYTDEQIKQFFELSYKFLSERYGEQNVISAYVHMDETTPHMHFLFIPIVDDKKWNEKHPDNEPRVKVCAKELMNMTEMNVFHRVLQEYMDQHSQKGLFPVLNGTTIGGNRTIAELKAKSALEEAIDATKHAEEIKEAANQSVIDANEQVRQVQSEIVNIQEAKLIAEEDTEKWLEELEKKELPVMKELKDGLTDLGADKDDYDSIAGFTKALEHPVKSSTGKVFVEIPNPEKTLPVLKKVMRKLTSVIEKTKDIARKIAGHAEQTRVSIRAKLAEAQEEAKRHNEERKPTHKKNDLSR